MSVDGSIDHVGLSSSRRSRYELSVDAATSARMGRIRQRDTNQELAVRRLLRSFGVGFRTDNRDLPGSPDIVNRSRRWAIFVHGCFWHAHEGCKRATLPKANRDFWIAKFEDNRARDRKVVRALRHSGLRVAVVWQCELDSVPRLRRRLRRFVLRGHSTVPRRSSG